MGTQAIYSTDARARQQELRHLAALRIHSGELPCQDASRLFAGPGHQGLCSLCGESIGAQEIEFEIAAANTGLPARVYYLHLRCYNAWIDACRTTPR